MKRKHVVLLIFLIVAIDQILKYYIKTSFHLNESRPVFGSWFQLYFVENPGMAYGWKFGGNFGKIALTVFRLIAVIFGTWYLGHIIKKGYRKGFIICAALVYAGALGNLIDSCFYGMIFDRGMTFDPAIGEYIGYGGLATFSSAGYASFLHGNVVDMLYFPIIKGHFPEWMPFWGGEYFEFFRPVFNIADASISTGIITILVFQKKLLAPLEDKKNTKIVETTAIADDNVHIL